MKLLLDEMHPSLIARELRVSGTRRRFGSRVSGVWPRTNPGALIVALDELLESTPEQPIDSELWL